MELEMVYVDEEGQIFEHTGWGMTGCLGKDLVVPKLAELIPLPEGASLTALPGRYPIGLRSNGTFETLREHSGTSEAKPVFAVGALLPQGFTRTLLPSYQRGEGAPMLPLFGYAAVGFRQGQLWVAAQATDQNRTWNPKYYNTPLLKERIKRRIAAKPENRILQQLARCAWEYSCFTAQNLFYRRWEAGMPFSPTCNARCLGCISLQPAECCPSPQQRIEFQPTVREAIDLAVPHLQRGQEAIISFGQGCEGEPCLRGADLVQVVQGIRQQTNQGTINLNSNGSQPQTIAQLSQAGLNALRVSLISANPELYQAYYRPRGYGLSEVRSSIQAAVDQGVYVSLNLLHFPGVTDREEELEALIQLVRETGVKMIQIRNLNLDPEVFLQNIPPAQGAMLGVLAMLDILQQELPFVQVGNFTREILR